MKANCGKSYLLLSSSEKSTISVDGCCIESNIKEVLLVPAIDRNLKFDDHVNNLCRKPCQKRNAL